MNAEKIFDVMENIDYLRTLFVETLIINTTSLRYFGNIPGDGAGVGDTAHENYLVRQH